MTIWQTLTSGLKRKSKHKKNWIWGPPKAEDHSKSSRQQRRRAALIASRNSVNRNNPTMPRDERRKLAKAYAVQVFKNMQEQAKQEPIAA